MRGAIPSQFGIAGRSAGSRDMQLVERRNPVHGARRARTAHGAGMIVSRTCGAHRTQGLADRFAETP